MPHGDVLTRAEESPCWTCSTLERFSVSGGLEQPGIRLLQLGTGVFELGFSTSLVGMINRFVLCNHMILLIWVESHL